MLYSAWQAVRRYNINDFDVLELSVDRKIIARYFSLFPLERISKNCGSYEYKYCRYSCVAISKKNPFLNHDNFENVLFYAPFDFVNELVKIGVGQAKREIEQFRRAVIKIYLNQKPKHVLCKLKATEKCVCRTKKHTKQPGFIKPVQIGLGVETKVKIPRVKASDVVKDEHTTVSKKQDKHILYAAGWILSDSKKD